MKKVLSFCMAFIASTVMAQAAIKVTPTVLELNTDKTKGNYLTTSLSIQGSKDDIVRFKAYPEFFNITQDGKMDAIQKSDAKNSLVSHVRIVPNEFTIQKGQAQKVRITVADLATLPEGESRMVLFLEDVAAKEVILPSANKNVATKLIVKTRVGVPIYVDKGKYTKVGTFDDLKVEKQNKDLVYKIKLSSQGNSKVRYTGKAQVIKNRSLVGEFPVNSNTVRAGGDFLTEEKLPLDLISENGEYSLRVILNYENENGKNKNLVRETTFSVQNKKSPAI